MSIRAVGRFIGRKHEIGKVFDEVFAPKTGWGAKSSSFRVIGEGGVGKTTFLLELQKLLSSGRPSTEMTRELLKGRAKKIVLVEEFSSSTYSRRFMAGLRDAADMLHTDIEVCDANGNLERMRDMLAAVVDSKPDAIIVSLGTNAKLGAEVARASEQGIGVVTVDNFDADLRSAHASLTQSNVEQAHRLFDRLATDLGNQGEVLVFHDEILAPFQQRFRGLSDGLEKWKGIQIRLLRLDLVGNSDDVKQRVRDSTIEALVTNPNIRAIWTPWSELVEPVTLALATVSRSNVGIYSFDVCSEDDLDKIYSADHPWRAAASVDPYQAGQASLRLATHLAYGQDIFTHHNLPYELFTKTIGNSDRARTNSAHRYTYSFPRNDIALTPWLKLRLAQMGQEKYTLVLPVFDFDNSTFHDPRNIWFKAATELERMSTEKEVFDDFFRLLASLTGVPRLDADSDQQRDLRTTFAECLNVVASRFRIVFLFDTVDALAKAESDHIAFSIASVMRKADNCVWIFAGRDKATDNKESHFWTSLKKHVDPTQRQSADIVLGDLEEYVGAIQEALEADHIPRMSSALVTKTVECFGARPIWIALAALWHANHLDEAINLPLALYTTDQIEALLVSDTIRIGDDIGKVIFALSHIYPLSRDLAHKLFPQFDVAIIDNLLLRCAELPYVKTVASYVLQLRPQDSNGINASNEVSIPNISLSDVMRDLIQRHLWSRIDPLSYELMRLSKIAYEHYEAEREKVTRHIQNSRNMRVEDQTRAYPVGYRSTNYETAFRIELESLVRKSFYHRLLSVAENRDHALMEEIDRARYLGNLYLAESLLNLAKGLHQDGQHFALRFDMSESDDTQFAIRLMEAVLLYDQHDAASARERFDQLISENEKRVGRLQEMYNRRGVSRRKLGDFAGALDDQLSALEQCESQNSDDCRPPILNQLGICHYLLCQWAEAQDLFKQAYALALASKSPSFVLIGSTLNWRASVLRQLGALDRAKSYCTSALEAWHVAGVDKWIARGEITMGSICRDLGTFDEAITHLNSARSRIDEGEDPENPVSLWLQLGSTLRMRFESGASDLSVNTSANGDLDAARTLLTRALEKSENSGYRERLIAIHFQLAKVYQAGDDIQRARAHVEKAIELGTKPWHDGGVPDPRYLLESFVLQAEIDFSSDALSVEGIRQLAKKLRDLADFVPQEWPIQYGKLSCIQAMVYQRNNQVDEAIASWQSGIASIARVNGIGQFILHQELRKLRDALRQIPETAASQYVQSLLNSWADSDGVTEANMDLLRTYVGQTMAVIRYSSSREL